MIRLSFTLACLLLSGTAFAQRVSNVNGKTLMAACTGKQAETCDAYLDGFADAILEEGKANAAACVPRTATGTEIRDVVVTWLKANPQSQHEHGAEITKSALAKAYPCTK